MRVSNQNYRKDVLNKVYIPKKESWFKSVVVNFNYEIGF